ncbi:MAG: hypothetical protein MJY80_08050 [Bacteroidales bacterium]|nr:hypothetical protein [Bacteroidales bacterium]
MFESYVCADELCGVVLPGIMMVTAGAGGRGAPASRASAAKTKMYIATS